MDDEEEEDLYETLQVSPKAEPEVIEAAFRRLARKYHPDANGVGADDARMKRLNAAFGVLRDAGARQRYDNERRRRRARKKKQGRKPSRKRTGKRREETGRADGARVEESEPHAPESNRPPYTGTADPNRSRRYLAYLILGATILITAMIIDGTRGTPRGNQRTRPSPVVRPAPPPLPAERTITYAFEHLWPGGTVGACSEIRVSGPISLGNEDVLRRHFASEAGQWKVGGRSGSAYRPIQSCSAVPRRTLAICELPSILPTGLSHLRAAPRQMRVYSPAEFQTGGDWCANEGGLWRRAD
ncbi:MAG: J domain-containing protein [Sandaracinaceae bacterium]